MSRITTLEQLAEAARNKRSVHCPKSHCFEKPLPAAWAVNMNGSLLLRLFTSGMYLYEKPVSK